MALTIDQCSQLLKILEEPNIKNQTLEALVNEVSKKFDPIDYFKVGTCLVMLLQQDLLTDPEQRLVAVTVLRELYRGEPIGNTPFVNVFMQLLHPPEQQSNVGAPKLEYPGQLPKFSNPEKHFISQLLLDIPKDALLKKTALQIINSDVIGTTNYDLSAIQLAVAEKQLELPQTCKTAIPVVLSFPNKQSNSYEGIIDDRQDTAKKIATGENPPISRVYKPEFVTLAPPLMNCQDEVIFIVGNLEKKF